MCTVETDLYNRIQKGVDAEREEWKCVQLRQTYITEYRKEWTRRGRSGNVYS